MATIQDRHNPSRKVTVTANGELKIIGNQPDGSIRVTETGDESKIIDDVSSTNITFFCYAPPGTDVGSAAWKIKIIDETGGYPVVKYADGDDEYDNIAADRNNLSYS